MTVTLSSAGGGSSVPNWQLLQTSTPSGVSTVTFSGLSGYAKYRVESQKLAATGGLTVDIRINGDSGGNYSVMSKSLNGATWASAGNAGYASVTIVSNGSNSPAAFWVEIDKALLLSPKGLIFSGALAALANDGSGLYQTTSATTSITVLSTQANNFTAGSIYLYGAN